MTDPLYNDIPVATACFIPNSSSSSVNNAEFTITSCNHAFTVFFEADLTGMIFSAIADRFPKLSDNFTFIFNEIAKNAEAGIFHFVCGGGSQKYDIHLNLSHNRYTVCIIDAGIRNAGTQNAGDEDRLRLALKSISTGVIVADCPDGVITYMNPAAHLLTGWGEDAIGMEICDVLVLSHEDSLRPADFFSHEGLQKIHSVNGSFVVLQSKSGETSSISLSLTPISSPDNQGSFVVIFNDSSAQRQYEKEIAYLSYHDKLTGLYNRAYFEKKLKEFDKICYYPVSIIMGDANGLKMTNDIFGHSQGDTLLITIANILSLACRDTDIVARYGGDEFIVAMPNTPIDDAARVCKNILNLCCGQQIDKSKISISLGYSCKERVTESMNDTLNVAEDFMYRHKLLESRSYRSSVISSLKKMLFEKSFETEEHAMRLTGLCAEAGQRLGLSQSDLNDLELFSMLHDIGKIGVKDQVLLKPGKLTDDEWIEMRKHCEIGYRIAQSAPELSHIADYILCHHERFDGGGYPQGLKGTQIPLLSRILAVADSYDAMVNDRYYRKALSKDAAIAELKRCSSTQFDPDIVKVFLQILEPQTSVFTVSA